MRHTASLFVATALSIVALGACTTSELIEPPGDASVDAQPRIDRGQLDAQPNGDSTVMRLDAATDGTPPDAGADAQGILYLDGGALDGGPMPVDGGPPVDALPADSGVIPGDPLDCAALAAAGHSVCGATPTQCAIVFYDGSGCAEACASGGLRCAASYRDDDDDPAAPACAIHPTGEAFDCAETGHQSDYCECAPAPPLQVAFEGAEGFGALSEGGRGGEVFTVTNLNDSGAGSLRWAVERRGRRIVRFDVSGVIRLRSALRINEPNITIDGRGALDAGEAGITIRDYPIDIRTEHVIIRYLRVRLGDWAVLQRNDAQNRARPAGSDDLDCINIHQSRHVILDHMSLGWSADEIVSVTNSRDVTIQWSILHEPLGRRALHPYGDNHAYAANNSAATLTYHHNLFAHYRFRGPQFEANDMQDSNPRFDAKFEAVNNVIYGYTDSGSRYRTGFERDQDRVNDVDFSYHFVGNRYVNADRGRSEIHAHAAFGYEDNIHLYVRGNIGPHRLRSDLDEHLLVFTDTGGDDPLRRDDRAFAQLSAEPLFAPAVPVTLQPADRAREAVLDMAGCDLRRDAIDARVVDDVRQVRPARLQSSQENAGGWDSY